MGNTDPGCFALAGRRARVVEFFWAWPDPALIETVHEQGALVSWQVGSREEAVAAAAAGSDLIVAQGMEAGGHVRGKIGILALLDEVLAAVDVPVLAAGGVGTGRALAAVLAAGADGARVGTRFVAAEESDAHPLYVEALLAAGPADTVYTEAFSVGMGCPSPRIALLCGGRGSLPRRHRRRGPDDWTERGRHYTGRVGLSAPNGDRSRYDRHHRCDGALGRGASLPRRDTRAA